eukprot:COSAG02_NODE_55721_length_289_cov_0.647368_1_plen_46_part_01
MHCVNGLSVRSTLQKLIGVRYSTYQWLDDQQRAAPRTNNHVVVDLP